MATCPRFPVFFSILIGFTRAIQPYWIGLFYTHLGIHVWAISLTGPVNSPINLNWLAKVGLQIQVWQEAWKWLYTSMSMLLEFRFHLCRACLPSALYMVVACYSGVTGKFASQTRNTVYSQFQVEHLLTSSYMADFITNQSPIRSTSHCSSSFNSWNPFFWGGFLSQQGDGN